jgi:thiosulfate/3-mercaptopyruvate sulfurtransferase
MNRFSKAGIFMSILMGLSFSFFSFVFQTDPYEADQLMDPAALAKRLNDPKAQKPIILNVGPMDMIKNAREIGIGSTPEGMEAFKNFVDKLPLQQEIVIYCGCCKLGTCPNIQKANLYLETRGYTRHKILNIPTSLDDDWIKKGYPMAK